MTVMTVKPATRRKASSKPGMVRQNQVYRRRPATNVVELDDAFEITMAVPGLTKKDIQINLDDDVLTIQADKATDEMNFTRKEFDYSSFKREFIIPESVNPEKINASYKAGILTITLEKMEDKKRRGPREISVK